MLGLAILEKISRLVTAALCLAIFGREINTEMMKAKSMGNRLGSLLQTTIYDASPRFQLSVFNRSIRV